MQAFEPVLGPPNQRHFSTGRKNASFGTGRRDHTTSNKVRDFDFRNIHFEIMILSAWGYFWSGRQPAAWDLQGSALSTTVVKIHPEVMILDAGGASKV